MPAKEVIKTSLTKAATMLVYVNEHEYSVNDKCNINFLLDNIDLKKKKGIAVAVNYEVISKDKWNEVYLSENDRIIIISATKGG